MTKTSPPEPPIVVRPRPHGMWLSVALSAVATWALAQYWLPLQERQLLVPALLAYGGLLLVLLVLPWIVLLTRRVSLDDERVTVAHGLLRSSIQEVRLDEVREVRLTRGVIQRLAGTGTLQLDTDRGTTLELEGVPVPRQLQQVIDARVAPARMRLASRLHWEEITRRDEPYEEEDEEQ